ncbi:class I glutamine amidotransferase-like protein [Aspergillus cavernicola]|uniref:Class I glutamine amidotransferase-like protein n=1 Tax=Aspergillus cavernicola TaxID=176166 RepID=A0ABR4IUA3_9EURO
MPHAPLRIAILECDTPAEKSNAKYGGYYGVFSKLLHECAQALNQPDVLHPESGLELSRFDVVTEQLYPDLDHVDAVLLTGSKHNSFENHPWILKLVEFTKKAIADPRVKILGICFGHQIIGRALGVEVGRNSAGWEIAVCDVDLTEKGREIFGVGGLKIQQMHRDIVFSYPPDVIPLGSSPRCDVQGMYRAGKFITVQGHPEFREDIVNEVVKLRAEAGVFDKEQAEDALSRAGRPHDGIAIGVAFLKFLLE